MDDEQTVTDVGAAIDQAEVDTTRAAMSAAASEFASQVNADAAQAAAEVATAAVLDNGKLDAILETLGRIEARLSMAALETPQDDPEPPAVVVVEVEEETPVEEPQDDPGDDGDGVTVEDAGGVPEGRQRSKRGLMGRKRKG